jgi:hypothetical protein
MATKRKRDYAKEYRDYHAKPAQIKRRAGRNKARDIMEDKGLVREGDGKDVDHKNRNTLDNDEDNLRVQSRRRNRARNSHKRRG